MVIRVWFSVFALAVIGRVNERLFAWELAVTPSTTTCFGLSWEIMPTISKSFTDRWPVGRDGHRSITTRSSKRPLKRTFQPRRTKELSFNESRRCSWRIRRIFSKHASVVIGIISVKSRMNLKLTGKIRSILLCFSCFCPFWTASGNHVWYFKNCPNPHWS